MYTETLGKKGPGVVLQVNERARKKIQASAHLIWSLAVGCSPSTCFFVVIVVFFCGFFFHIFQEMNAFQRLWLLKAVSLQQS